MSAREDSLSFTYIRECFEYAPTTGVLTWRARPRSHFKTTHRMKAHATTLAGKVAGNLRTHGYLYTRVNDILLGNHRIIWMWYYGRWPLCEVDHINGVRTDNSIANLREANSTVNSRNLSKRKTNKSGVMGVHWAKAVNRWVAQGKGEGGVTVHLGCFYDIADAAAARKAFDRENGYHENHGRDKTISVPTVSSSAWEKDPFFEHFFG